MDGEKGNAYLEEMKKLLDEAVREGFMSRRDADERYADAQESDRMYQSNLSRRHQKKAFG